jgi:hypothetical protein
MISFLVYFTVKYNLDFIDDQEKFRPHQLFYRTQIHQLPILFSPQLSQKIQSASPLWMELLAEITIVALRLVDTLENGYLQPLDQCC